MIEWLKWDILNKLMELEHTELPREEVAERLARFVLGAMREPAPDMIRAMRYAMSTASQNSRDVVVIWQAGIDEALE